MTLPEHEISSNWNFAEELVSAYQKLRRGLEQDLLEQVNAASPAFFGERLVVKLLRAMGYGGSRQEAGEVVGRSGDEGIDRIINEDKLGLGVIYVQAKRWQATVGRPEIHRFAGALQDGQQRASSLRLRVFSKEAEDYAKLSNPKIVLIDGERLAELMVDYNVGVTSVGTYEVKKVNTDFFEGE